jgi:tetratricopeptide (TPR) repeat protein
MMKSQVYIRRGLIYATRMRDHDHAIGDFTRALELNAKSGDALNYRAQSYLEKGDYAHAVVDWGRAIQAEP